MGAGSSRPAPPSQQPFCQAVRPCQTGLNMLNYLYLDYGGRAQYRAELKYSLISLRAELDPERARIVVASDAPELYRNWPVRVMDIAPRIREWSGNGLYYHRVKPALVREALTLFAEPVLFLDSDSIVRPGFHAEVE